MVFSNALAWGEALSLIHNQTNTPVQIQIHPGAKRLPDLQRVTQNS